MPGYKKSMEVECTVGFICLWPRELCYATENFFHVVFSNDKKCCRVNININNVCRKIRVEGKQQQQHEKNGREKSSTRTISK